MTPERITEIINAHKAATFHQIRVWINGVGLIEEAIPDLLAHIESQAKEIAKLKEDVFQSRAWVEAWADRIMGSEAENTALQAEIARKDGAIKGLVKFLGETCLHPCSPVLIATQALEEKK